MNEGLHHGHVADRLLYAMERRGAPVCVGIDPVLERLPRGAGKAGYQEPAELIRSFTLGVLDAVTEYVPCVKFQSACYERYRDAGLHVLFEMIAEAKSRGLEVILDAKRGDIGISAEHYAAAAFGLAADVRASPDWLTVNAYLGPDGIQPFIDAPGGHGAFALVRTSNPGSDAVQSQRLGDQRTVAEAVAAMVAELGERSLGLRGYSALGAVVGATKAAEARSLREIMPRQLLLVPGYGAQGGSVEDVLPCFREDDAGGRTGAIVTASRSVIYTFKSSARDWMQPVRDAAMKFADEIGKATGMR